MADFEVGQRVKLLRDIWDDGHPPGYCAHAEEEVIVRKVNGAYPWPISVSHDYVTDGRTFCVGLDEIVAA